MHALRNDSSMLFGAMIFTIVWIGGPSSVAGENGIALASVMAAATLSIVYFAGRRRLVPSKATTPHAIVARSLSSCLSRT